jgi:methionine sulfoxide reductase catalytic subunit
VLIRVPQGWEIPERLATPEHVYRGRRELLRALGLGAGAALTGCYLSVDNPPVERTPSEALPELPSSKNPRFTVPERPLTRESVATTFNNYYEFSTNKTEVWRLVEGFVTHPWTVEVSGLVRSPRVYDVDELSAALEQEERVYRFRCVEAWAMTVPWTGFPFAALARLADPLPEARYVRFVTAQVPEQMPGLRSAPGYPWPYHEGLRLDEALNELTFLATGLYGKALPGQNGAPLRLVVPWQYGFKSIKSIVRIEFVAEEPPTFWNTLWAQAYPFTSNVDPEVAHPGWSQASELLIGDGQRVPTQKYNGYGEFVGHLYA